jgi:hypothetical protein
LETKKIRKVFITLVVLLAVAGISLDIARAQIPCDSNGDGATNIQDVITAIKAVSRCSWKIAWRTLHALHD